MNNDKIQQNRLWNFRQIIKNVGGIFLHRYACFPLINHLVLSYGMRIASQSITEIDNMTRINRALLWFQIFALEIHIEGQTKILGWLNDINGDPITRGNMEIARHHARAGLAHIRAQYNATLPVGQRRAWHMA